MRSVIRPLLIGALATITVVAPAATTQARNSRLKPNRRQPKRTEIDMARLRAASDAVRSCLARPHQLPSHGCHPDGTAPTTGSTITPS